MTSMIHSELFMREALRLARKGEGWTNPNPMVGAVIAKGEKIVGRGYHRGAGRPHAEVEALRNAGKKAKGATLYVNLEPCCHYGRTPPCTDALIKAGIHRVVCSTKDPNPKVSGKGVALLRKKGARVTVGCLQREARALNEAFFTFHEKQRSFVALKFAASLDGKMATQAGDSKWITNEGARKYGRTLRSHYQAILVGINTVLADDPHLGVRKKGRRDPLRIILDSRLRIPLKSKVLRDPNVLIVTTSQAPQKKKTLLEARGIPLHIFPEAHISVKQVLSLLRKRSIVSVLVEGGGETLGSFIDAKVADKVYAFYAPLLIGGKDSTMIGGTGAKAISEALRLKAISIQRFGDNVLIVGSR